MRKVNSPVVLDKARFGLELRSGVSVALSKSHCFSDIELHLQTWGESPDLLLSQEDLFHCPKWSMKGIYGRREVLNWQPAG